MILARWTYSKEEWCSFLFRHQKKRTLLQAVASRARLLPKSPEVIFTRESLHIGDRKLDLITSQKIREINLYEEGRVNVMRIVFDREELPIPIPRGRLREALELRKVLTF